MFKVHRKNAITNVQLKPNSGHDPKILKGVFTGFLHRAYTVCSQQHQQEEIEFLITNFADNGYKKKELVNIANEFRRKRDNPQHTQSEDNDPKQIVVLPWVPGLSPKLRKSFRNAGFKAVFKSFTNLKTPHITQQIQTTSPKPTGCLHDSLSVWQSVCGRDFNENENKDPTTPKVNR